MATTIYSNYLTNGSDNVIALTVQIGYAQIGATSVTLNGIPVVITPPADAYGNYAPSFTIPLDTNAALRGQILEVITDVNIIHPPTNSSVTITLNGGAAVRTYIAVDPDPGQPAPALGAIINYYAAITFI